ncbi:hypothetical protein BDZ89DRAFT_1068102 [Hymenopellis radicata]|nr:hypothetical protein BDZ89DRAFT_1068102 [Hymenopellis radicata]
MTEINTPGSRKRRAAMARRLMAGMGDDNISTTGSRLRPLQANATAAAMIGAPHGNDKSATASGSATAINGRTARQQRESTAVQWECAQRRKAAMTTGKVLNEERRSDNEGTRINGIDAKDEHGSSRTHGKSAR